MGPIAYTKPDHQLDPNFWYPEVRIPTSSYPHRKLYNMKMENQPFEDVSPITSPKTNIDTKNDGLEYVSPFKHNYFG